MALVYPPDLEQFVKHELASGTYRSEDELLINALTVFREMKHRHEEFRRRVQVSIEQAEHGEIEPWDIDAILAEAHKRHALNRATRGVSDVH